MAADVLFQNLIAQKASQFTGFAQHDAQEFMAFLLDGLHEVRGIHDNLTYCVPVTPYGDRDLDQLWLR